MIYVKEYEKIELDCNFLTVKAELNLFRKDKKKQI